MEILAQALPRPLPRQVAMVKIRTFQLRRSKSLGSSKSREMLIFDRLSREEREAAYNKARERIFGKEEKTGDATPGRPYLPGNFVLDANVLFRNRGWE